MHILFLTDNFPPDVNAPASRTFEHCREWVKGQDCDVTVITCVPNFPKGRVFDGYKNKLFQLEIFEGVRVIRVWSFITPNEGTVKRILDYLSFMVMATIASCFVRKVDIIVATSPQFFTACAGYLVSVIKRVPWVFELRDIWPESIKAVGAMEESVFVRFLERLELFLYRKASRIISVTNAFKDSLGARGIDTQKIDVVTNGVDATRFSPLPKDEEVLGNLGLHGKFIAGYIGTHGLAHGLDTILEAAHIEQDSRPGSKLHFLLLGDGAEKARLKARASELDLSNVTFVDSVSKAEVVRYWSILDVSIVHLKKTPLFESVIPSKIFECMGMGIPIAHGVSGESAAIIEACRAGMTLEPESSGGLLEVLHQLSSEQELSDEMSQCGQKSAKFFDRRALAKRMLEVLRDVHAES